VAPGNHRKQGIPERCSCSNTAAADVCVNGRARTAIACSVGDPHRLTKIYCTTFYFGYLQSK